jgi:hypothetical protein
MDQTSCGFSQRNDRSVLAPSTRCLGATKMNMKILIAFLLILPWGVPALAANECPNTPYRTTGQSCKDVGLDSNRAICRSSDRVALMCDDTKEGQIRTCATNIRCDNSNHSGQAQPRGYDNYGGQGYQDYRGVRGTPREGDWDRDHVFFRNEWRACDSLSFDRDGRAVGRCDRNEVNRDCRGRCERG